MNAANTGYYETDVDDLNITADKGLRQRIIIRTDTIQQSLYIESISPHRKIKDEATDPEQTTSNGNKLNDIKINSNNISMNDF